MKQYKTELDDTGERMVPEYHKGALIYAEHTTRYLAALPIVKGKVVLDIASGSGYGSQILATSAKKVYGVDISPEAVKYAGEHFNASNIEYLVGTGEDIPLESNSVDSVVTFETIEHIKDYKKFIDEIKRVMKADGVAIVSTPNDKEFAEGNHFHLHEFEYDELMAMLKKAFKYTQSYFQATWKYVAIGDEKMLTEKKSQVEVLNEAPITKEEALYFYVICSDRPITEKFDYISAVGAHYSDRNELQLINEKNHAITQLQQRVVELETMRAADSAHTAELEQAVVLARAEIEDIKGSRTYVLAKKMQDMKHKMQG